MFDFRYYVASIAGLFLMLAVGILLGVGISDRGFVDDAERDRLNGRIKALEQEGRGGERVRGRVRRAAAPPASSSRAPAVLVDRRLDGERVAVLVLGSRDQSLDFVRRGIVDGDGQGRADARDDAALAARGRRVGDRRQGGGSGATSASRSATSAATSAASWPRRRGRRCGTRSRARSSRSARRGDFSDPVDEVVVMRTAEPQTGESAVSSPGCTRAWGGSGIPVVGVEPSRVEESTIPVFSAIASRPSTGSTPKPTPGARPPALGADPGDYGVRDTADDGIVPPIVPLPAGD